MREMTAAIIIKDRKLLLVHNSKKGLRIEPCGGKREINETLKQCLIREVKEELGLIIKPIGLFDKQKTTSPEGDFMCSMFFAEILQGEPQLMEPDKISAFGWYGLKDLREFASKGILVPNVVSAMGTLEKYID